MVKLYLWVESARTELGEHVALSLPVRLLKLDLVHTPISTSELVIV